MTLKIQKFSRGCKSLRCFYSLHLGGNHFYIYTLMLPYYYCNLYLLILKFSWANFGCCCKVTRMVEITYPVSYMNQGHDFKFFCGLSVNLVELLIYKSLCLCKFLTVTQLEIAKYKQLRVGQDKYTRMSVGWNVIRNVQY